MSHFIAGTGDREHDLLVNQKHLLARFFPNSLEQRRSNGAFLLDSPMQKVLPDVHLECPTSGSWLSLIGMPLVESMDEHSGPIFVERFLSDPCQSLATAIDGHVAVVAYDKTNERLYVATDFNSFVPIFYTFSSDGILVSSSELFLAALVGGKIDPIGLAQSISLGTTWDDRTRFTAVKKLRPCELLVCSRTGRVTIESYWSPSNENPWTGDFDAVLERWMNLLDQSVRRFVQVSGQPEVSADLTGGEDSRLIVAQCHAIGIPLRTRVSGFPGETDFEAAQRIAATAQIPLVLNPLKEPAMRSVADNALGIALLTEGYGSFFSVGERFENFRTRPPIEETKLHFCGVPGGEAYRGTYYLRARLLLPQWQRRVDTRFFGRMKFLLDFIPGLHETTDESFREIVFSCLSKAVDSVSSFPAGTQVDHLLRTFQTALWSLVYRQPFYLPLGLRDITKSIYSVPPGFKQQSKLTRAATELLFPKLAFAPTANGVPTIRQTWRRTPLFLPGYYATARKITLGAIRRAAHFKQDSKTLTKHHRIDRHQISINAILNESQYSSWFKNCDSMLIGGFFNPNVLNALLDDARRGDCRFVQVLGQIINAEIAIRQVS